MTPSDAKPLLPGLHVILGDSAAGIFTRIHHARERLLIDQDVLCCGPTPRYEDPREWVRVRGEYWTSLVPDSEERHIHSPFNLDDNAHKLRDAQHIYIWAATSLSEQLFIAHVVHIADLVGADPARISVLQFVTLQGRARILGMGELNEENLSNHPEPQALSPDALADYRAAWNALTSEDPTGFERFASERPAANVWLKNAMQLMLRRFPDARTGLPYWDSLLLQCVHDRGPRAARIIGHAMAVSWDDGDLTGDSYLFGRLLRLGDERLPKPLLAFTGERTSMRKLDVALTPFGEEVRSGAAPSYPANPIADATGGVRLSSADGKLWFTEGGRLVR